MAYAIISASCKLNKCQCKDGYLIVAFFVLRKLREKKNSVSAVVEISRSRSLFEAFKTLRFERYESKSKKFRGKLKSLNFHRNTCNNSLQFHWHISIRVHLNLRGPGQLHKAIFPLLFIRFWVFRHKISHCFNRVEPDALEGNVKKEYLDPSGYKTQRLCHFFWNTHAFLKKNEVVFFSH